MQQAIEWMKQQLEKFSRLIELALSVLVDMFRDPIKFFSNLVFGLEPIQSALTIK